MKQQNLWPFRRLAQRCSDLQGQLGDDVFVEMMEEDGAVPESGLNQLGGGFKLYFLLFSIFIYFHSISGKIPILRNIFQMGCNHQLVRFCNSFAVWQLQMIFQKHFETFHKPKI